MKEFHFAEFFQEDFLSRVGKIFFEKFVIWYRNKKNIYVSSNQAKPKNLGQLQILLGKIAIECLSPRIFMFVLKAEMPQGKRWFFPDLVEFYAYVRNIDLTALGELSNEISAAAYEKLSKQFDKFFSADIKAVNSKKPLKLETSNLLYKLRQEEKEYLKHHQLTNQVYSEAEGKEEVDEETAADFVDFLNKTYCIKFELPGHQPNSISDVFKRTTNSNDQFDYFLACLNKLVNIFIACDIGFNINEFTKKFDSPKDDPVHFLKIFWGYLDELFHTLVSIQYQQQYKIIMKEEITSEQPSDKRVDHNFASYRLQLLSRLDKEVIDIAFALIDSALIPDEARPSYGEAFDPNRLASITEKLHHQVYALLTLTNHLQRPQYALDFFKYTLGKIDNPILQTGIKFLEEKFAARQALITQVMEETGSMMTSAANLSAIDLSENIDPSEKINDPEKITIQMITAIVQNNNNFFSQLISIANEFKKIISNMIRINNEFLATKSDPTEETVGKLIAGLTDNIKLLKIEKNKSEQLMRNNINNQDIVSFMHFLSLLIKKLDHEIDQNEHELEQYNTIMASMDELEELNKSENLEDSEDPNAKNKIAVLQL